MMKLKRYEEAREMIQSWKQAMLVLAVMLLMMAGCQKKIVEDPSEPISDQVANRYEVDFDGDYRLENLEKTMDAYLTEANLATETKTRVYYTWDTSGEVNGGCCRTIWVVIEPVFGFQWWRRELPRFYQGEGNRIS